jgi:hypothetical protein
MIAVILRMRNGIGDDPLWPHTHADENQKDRRNRGQHTRPQATTASIIEMFGGGQSPGGDFPDRRYSRRDAEWP